jgi:hypothetical protein
LIRAQAKRPPSVQPADGKKTVGRGAVERLTDFQDFAGHLDRPVEVAGLPKKRRRRGEAGPKIVGTCRFRGDRIVALRAEEVCS